MGHHVRKAFCFGKTLIHLFIFSASGEYDEGLTLYKSLKKLSLEDFCQMGVAFYKQENYDDSKYGMYSF